VADINVKNPFEKFTVPHQFTPRLSLYGALVAIGAALTRIFTISIIGALWGVGIWTAADSLHSIFWKIALIFVQAAGLAASVAGILRAIHIFEHHLAPPPPPSPI